MGHVGITFPEKAVFTRAIGGEKKDKYERRQFSDQLDHFYPLSSQLELKIWSESC